MPATELYAKLHNTTCRCIRDALRRGWSYRQIEQVTGVSDTQLRRIKEGSRQPSLEVACRIMEAAGLIITVSPSGSNNASRESYWTHAPLKTPEKAA